MIQSLLNPVNASILKGFKEEQNKEIKGLVERVHMPFVRCVCPICGCVVVYPIHFVSGKGEVGQCYNCGMFYAHVRFCDELLKIYYKRFLPGFLINPEIWAEDLFRRPILNNSDLNILEKYTHTKGSLLDIGACAGDFLLFARDRGWTIIGQELSMPCINIMNFLDIYTIYGFVHETTYKSKIFDIISMRHTFEHSPYPSLDLLILREALADDGLLFIVVPVWEGIEWCKGEGHNLPQHLSHFTEYTLNAMLQITGFEPLSMEFLPSSSAITDSTQREILCNLRVVARKSEKINLSNVEVLTAQKSDWEKYYNADKS